MYTNSATEQLVKPNRVLFEQEQETEIFQQWRSAEGRVKQRLHQRLILNYGPIVYKIVRAMDGYVNTSSRIERDDLIQVGLEGLCGAADRFDMEKGFRFSTYAQTWVRGVMYAYIAKNFFIVNPCANGVRKKMFFRLRSMIYQHNKNSNESFELTPDIIQMFATSFDTTPLEVSNLLCLFRSPQESLSEPAGNGGDEETSMTREDMLVDPLDSYEELAKDEQHKFRKEIIIKAVNKKLDEREKVIYLTQMLTENGQELTLQTLGQRFGISKERVRQIRERADKLVAREIRRMLKEQEISRADLF